MYNPASFDLNALDQVIEEYSYDEDPILAEHFRPIEDALWGLVEHYGEGVNDFGKQMAAHLRRTSLDGMKFMAGALGFSEKAARNFHAANLFHDLGKIHGDYDPAIWDLPHQPTQAERAEKRKHTLRGPQVLSAALADAPRELLAHPHIKIVIPAIQLFHHERIDGKGPFSRTGDELGSVIKMAAIIDAKDGDMMRRPHHDFRRGETETLLRMKGLPEYDAHGKYIGAFDEMLDQYIAYREQEADQPAYPASPRASA